MRLVLQIEAGSPAHVPAGRMATSCRLRTSARDYFPIDTVYLYRYDNRQWVRSSGLLPAR